MKRYVSAYATCLLTQQHPLLREDGEQYVLASERRAKDSSRIDLDTIRGLALPPEAAPQATEDLTSFVLEPSVAPYRAPIVTWGSLDATPRPLEEFSITQTPRRETVCDESFPTFSSLFQLSLIHI